ncbi:MAG: dTMP kinase [Holosporales bacterium]|jgi:dTMP kinase|nr:dTMP kinase [Holosporales bacterium]
MQDRHHGLFITFEGGEGCGKSLQSRMLFDWLVSSNKDVILTREPGGTDLSENIRRLLLVGNINSWDPTTESLLFLAARSDHWFKKIFPALTAGSSVVCDRFQDSSIVYQGICKGVSLDMLDKIYLEITGGKHPDRTYLLDIPPEVGIRRSISRSDNNETRFEKMDIGFHEKVRNAFLELADRYAERYLILDGNLSTDEIHDQIKEDLTQRFHNIFS